MIGNTSPEFAPNLIPDPWMPGSLRELPTSNPMMLSPFPIGPLAACRALGAVNVPSGLGDLTDDFKRLLQGRDLTGAAYKVINAAVTTRDLILHDSYYFSFYTVYSEILDPIAFKNSEADWSLDEWSRKIEGSESRKAWRC